MRISVGDWLKLAYEDIITADDKVKALYDWFSSIYKNGYFNNNMNILDCYNHLYNYAKEHQKNNFYMIGGTKLLELFNDYLGFEPGESVDIYNVRLEDLL